MKISKIAFVFTALIVTTSMTIICKSSKKTVVIKPHAHCDIQSLLNKKYNTNQKKVIFIRPWQDMKHISEDLILCLESISYNGNKVEVSEMYCEVQDIDFLKNWKPHFSNYVNRFFMRGTFNLDGCIFAHKAFSLISDTNKKIDIYAIRYNDSNETLWYSMSHKGCIAIFIDEQDTVISILDDFKFEKDDIFKIFDINQ